MALNGLYCADVPLRNCSLVHSVSLTQTVQDHSYTQTHCQYRTFYHDHLCDVCFLSCSSLHLAYTYRCRIADKCRVKISVLTAQCFFIVRLHCLARAVSVICICADTCLQRDCCQE